MGPMNPERDTEWGLPKERDLSEGGRLKQLMRAGEGTPVGFS